MKVEIAVPKEEIENNKRYELFLHAIHMGLKNIGVNDISFSPIYIKDGSICFEIENKEIETKEIE